MQRYQSETDKRSYANASRPTQRRASTASIVDNREQVRQRQLKGAIQRAANNTGLPNQLKSGMEQLSGFNLDHIRVHYNSAKPAAVQAYAYAQGSDIHLASGQERHLPHELGHVVQQMQGRVQPTTTVAGMAVNDSKSLEQDADHLGSRALQMRIRSTEFDAG